MVPVMGVKVSDKEKGWWGKVDEVGVGVGGVGEICSLLPYGYSTFCMDSQHF